MKREKNAVKRAQILARVDELQHMVKNGLCNQSELDEFLDKHFKPNSKIHEVLASIQ